MPLGRIRFLGRALIEIQLLGDALEVQDLARFE
jgi:hypothetical protein